jgi:molybdopterin synthase catalytic subunit
MRIHVRYFAVLRERLRSDGETLELPDESSVAQALAALGEKHDVVRKLAGRFQIAVNQAMVPTATVLHDGDELVLIPPVAGGSDRLACVLDQPLSLDRVVAAVVGPDKGGLVTFTGIVRNSDGGHDVERLEYEAYAEMADKVLRELCDEIEAEIPGCRVAVEHRVGTLVVGDIAVAIGAAAPHRPEAFRACRAMIDRLKQRTPIWKKQVGPDGEEWIGLGP